MDKVFVQFLDETESKVVSVFDCRQSEKDHPNQGEIDKSDSRYIEFMEAFD